MTSRVLLDDAGAGVLRAAWLDAAVAPVSPYGERLFAVRSPYAPGEEAAARERAERVGAAAGLDVRRLDAVRGVLGSLPDAAPAIARAALGETLSDPALLELMRFCEGIERIDALLGDASLLPPVGGEDVTTVGEALLPGRRGALGFYLADAFDPALAAARAAAAAAQAELDASRGRDVAAAARALRRDDIGTDEFILMRADLAGPLPAGVRVLREAATYLLCALDFGEASLAALERLDAAQTRVADAEEDVRARLSMAVRQRAARLEAAARALGELDVLLGAATFARRYACTPAEIAEEPVLEFAGGRFLPLACDLEAAGRAFTPVDVRLHDVAVLTGPNMGGKSVCLQTCGFVALCAAYGLPVPAVRARVGLFDEIAWLGMGRDGEAGGLLSSFAREVVQMKAIFDRAAPRLLALVDEFARTTTPHEGKALLVALIERLQRGNACGMLATHLGGVARAARVRHFAVRGLRAVAAGPPARDLPSALAALAGAMDYSVTEVAVDEVSAGDAIALAALLGVDEEFVTAAYKALER